MNRFAPHDFLVVALRIFLKSLGAYVILQLDLDPYVVLFAIGGLVFSEVYDTAAMFVARRSRNWRIVSSAITGTLNIVLVLVIITLIGELDSDLYLFVLAAVVGIGIDGGLFSGSLVSLTAGIGYLMLSANAGVPLWESGVRSVFIVFIGVIVSILSELYIRQREQNQLILEDKTKEKETAAIKHKFITAASHHLRTPLTVIKGYVELLKEPDATDTEQKEAVDRLGTEVHELEDLIEKLIHIAGLQSISEKLQLESQSLTVFLQKLTDRFQPIADQKNIRIVYHPDPNQQIIAEFDTQQMDMAVSNLISNAIKYSPQDGHVLITTAQTQTNVYFSVQDSGEGIPKEEQERLFTMFYQAGSTFKAHEGTGVGLFIAKEIVKAHKGTISVQSEPGRGSIFTIELPKISMHRLVQEM